MAFVPASGTADNTTPPGPIHAFAQRSGTHSQTEYCAIPNQVWLTGIKLLMTVDQPRQRIRIREWDDARIATSEITCSIRVRVPGTRWASAGAGHQQIANGGMYPLHCHTPVIPPLVSNRLFDDQERRRACREIRWNRMLQRFEVHLLPAVYGNQSQRIAPQTCEIERAPDATMHRRRRVCRQFPCACRNALPPHVAAEPGITCHHHSQKVCHGCASHEEPGCRRGKSKQGAHSLGNLIFHLERNLVGHPGWRSSRRQASLPASLPGCPHLVPSPKSRGVRSEL